MKCPSSSASWKLDCGNILDRTAMKGYRQTLRKPIKTLENFEVYGHVFHQYFVYKVPQQSLAIGILVVLYQGALIGTSLRWRCRGPQSLLFASLGDTYLQKHFVNLTKK